MVGVEWWEAGWEAVMVKYLWVVMLFAYTSTVFELKKIII